MVEVRGLGAGRVSGRTRMSLACYIPWPAPSTPSTSHTIYCLQRPRMLTPPITNGASHIGTGSCCPVHSSLSPIQVRFTRGHTAPQVHVPARPPPRGPLPHAGLQDPGGARAGGGQVQRPGHKVGTGGLRGDGEKGVGGRVEAHGHDSPQEHGRQPYTQYGSQAAETWDALL